MTVVSYHNRVLDTLPNRTGWLLAWLLGLDVLLLARVLYLLRGV